VRIIAHAKIKTDTIDAKVLAQLYARGFLREVWMPDEPTQGLRRQLTRRNKIVRQRSRLQNIIQSIPHSHLIPSCPHADLCGASGRAWLFHQVLPQDDHVERHLSEFDRLGDDLKVIERDLARSALGNEGVKRLMTIAGVDIVVALAIVTAIGDVGRFEQSQKMVGYLALNPSVRQSGPGPRITAGSRSRPVQGLPALHARELRDLEASAAFANDELFAQPAIRGRAVKRTSYLGRRLRPGIRSCLGARAPARRGTVAPLNAAFCPMG
jgi:transposase